VLNFVGIHWFMKQILRIAARIVMVLVLVSLLLFGLLFLYLYFTEYKPAPTEIAGSATGTDPAPLEEMTFRFMTWNIGYAGLDREMDFFYDGGVRVRTDRNSFDRNLAAIGKFIQANDSMDFILLQEVDTFARRSYFHQEHSILSGLVPGKHATFVRNYDVRFVPLPVTEPMGRVISGLSYFSEYAPVRQIRHGFAFHFPMPDRLAMLKRCFLESRYRLANGRDLVVICLHNSVFDKNGEIRKQELKFLHEFMITEFDKGNYVVAGGDWNINPRGFKTGRIVTGDREMYYEPPMDPDFLPGWTFASDSLYPSNRDVKIPYVKGITHTTILDYFVLSPNIRLLSVHTRYLSFEHSDHHPVMMEVQLIP